MYSPLIAGLLFLGPFAFQALADENLGTLYPSVSLTSDYRINGISASNRGPAVQGSLHWRMPDGLFAGVWASNVDFNDPNATSVELDVYAGRQFDIDRASIQIEGTYSSFDDHERGPTYDFWQAKIRASYAFDHLTWATSAAWSPEGTYGAGTTWQIRGEASYRIAPWFITGGMMGRGMFAHRVDRTYWNAGVTTLWRRVSVDLRYVDTNLSVHQCLNTDWCEAAVVGTVTVHLSRVKLSTE